jgi:hypothetical protein
MKRSSERHRIRDRNRSNASVNTDPSDPEDRVGPGRPPKEHRWKPGQSGNPKGAPRKPASIAPELAAIVERSLNGKVTLRQGEKEKIVTKFAAGMEQLATQFAKGDRYARRDLFLLLVQLRILEGMRKAREKKERQLRVMTSDMSLQELSAAYAQSVRELEFDPET